MKKHRLSFNVKMKFRNVCSCIVILLLLWNFLFVLQSNNMPEKGVSGEAHNGYIGYADAKTCLTISDKLMGFNLIYPHEKDMIWMDGKLAGYLRDMKVAFLRYPGGTVCSYYHWNALTGEGWKDSWDPNRQLVQKSPSEFMDIDEYITLVRKTGATPLVGINMSSGWRWNRQDDGLKEALTLMQYCKDQNFKVEYWYLDNEPYMHDSNGGSKTPEQYAALINVYAHIMKAFDPNIKIVVNWNAGFKNKRTEYDQLIRLAGANIDVIDVHWYWSWNDASWQKWIEKTPMVQWTGYTYDQDIKYFREMVKELGYPNIKMASFEWNTGSPKEGFTPARMALTQIEMMMQFIKGGLDMAIMWPIHWPDTKSKNRSLYNEMIAEINPVYHLFNFFGNMQGGKYYDTKTLNSVRNMVSFIASDPDEKTLRICVLNKNNENITTEIQIDQFPLRKIKEALVYKVSDDGCSYSIEEIKVDTSKKNKLLGFRAPGISLTMLSIDIK